VHEAFPWIVTWDDHETENDYVGFAPENAADPADKQPDFASRRARAYQAYYEHMPLRASQEPTGPFLQLYRRPEFGRVQSMNVLDTRQYRSHRAPASCALGDRIDGYCPTALDPSRTIEGAAQPVSAPWRRLSSKQGRRGQCKRERGASLQVLGAFTVEWCGFGEDVWSFRCELRRYQVRLAIVCAPGWRGGRSGYDSPLENRPPSHPAALQ
jgi:hypothetical protein